MHKVMTALSIAIVSAPLLASCASLADEFGHFRFAALSPLRDFNLTQAPIPQQLNALAQPYGYIDQSGCQAWGQEIDSLEASLRANDGRRVGFRRDSETFVGRTGNLRDSGVRSLTSQFVPFRSVIRQASGASRFEQRANNASDRARYRIGYLVGLGRAHRCPGFGTLSPFAPAPNTVQAWTLPQRSQLTPVPPYRPVTPYRPAPPTYVRTTHPSVASTQHGIIRRR